MKENVDEKIAVDEKTDETENVVEEENTVEEGNVVVNNVENKGVKKKKTRNTIFKILDVIIVLVLIYFIIGYVNFYKITNDKKPLFTISEKSYNVEGGKVKVYHNGLYKIVEHEVTDVNKTFSLKLWFMKDVK